MGLIVTIAGLLALTSIVNYLGADSDTFAPTHSYVSVILLGSALLMVNYAMGQLLRAEGAMMPSMLGMFIGTVSNIAKSDNFRGNSHTGHQIGVVIGGNIVT